METPPEIEFIGMAPDAEIRADIDKHLAELQMRFGRITACRVAVRAPGDSHKNGGRFEVKIHLALPDHKDINVDYATKDERRMTEVRPALHDAFKRARRQLQDRVRRMERMVKHHDPAPSGTVARIDPAGDFGFIATADGREVYFHRNSVLNGGFAKLNAGDAVTFAEEDGDKGAQASTVRPTGRRPAAGVR